MSDQTDKRPAEKRPPTEQISTLTWFLRLISVVPATMCVLTLIQGDGAWMGWACAAAGWFSAAIMSTYRSPNAPAHRPEREQEKA